MGAAGGHVRAADGKLRVPLSLKTDAARTSQNHPQGIRGVGTSLTRLRATPGVLLPLVCQDPHTTSSPHTHTLTTLPLGPTASAGSNAHFGK